MATKSRALTNVPEAEPKLAGLWNKNEVTAMAATIAKGLNNEEFMLFAEVCRRSGFDPFLKQIYAIKRGRGEHTTLTFQIGIDGMRSKGMANLAVLSTKTEWCGPDGEWVDIWLDEEPPAAARFTLEIANMAPIVGQALYREYVQMVDEWEGYGDSRKKTGVKRPNEMWGKMPANQLAKCAEAAAWRRAAPQYFSGLYANEEVGTRIAKSGEVLDMGELPASPEAGELLEPDIEDADFEDVSGEAAPAKSGPTLYNGETVEQISAKLTGMLDGRPMAYVVPVLPAGPNFNARLIAWAEAHPDVPVAAGIMGEAMDHHRRPGSDSSPSSEGAKPDPVTPAATPGKYGTPPRTVGQIMGALGTRADAAGLVWPSDFVASLPKAATLELMVEGYAKAHVDEPIVDILVEEALGRTEGAQGRLAT